MESRSYKIITLWGVALAIPLFLVTPAPAAKNPSVKRENVISKLIDSENNKTLSKFNRYVKKAINLYAQQIKDLKAATPALDNEAMSLLAEAEKFHALIQTGTLSHNAVIENLKQEHELMKLVEQKIKQLQQAQLDLESNTVATLSTGNGYTSTGNTEHAPGKKIRQDYDIYDVSISIPLEVGRRHGFDKLKEED